MNTVVKTEALYVIKGQNEVKCPYCENSRIFTVVAPHLKTHKKNIKTMRKEFPTYITTAYDSYIVMMKGAKHGGDNFKKYGEKTRMKNCWYHEQCGSPSKEVPYNVSGYLCDTCEAEGRKSKDLRILEKNNLKVLQEKYGVNSPMLVPGAIDKSIETFKKNHKGVEREDYLKNYNPLKFIPCPECGIKFETTIFKPDGTLCDHCSRPIWTGKEIYNRKGEVVCQICKRGFELINNEHLKRHGISLIRYRERFRDFPTRSKYSVSVVEAGPDSSSKVQLCIHCNTMKLFHIDDGIKDHCSDCLEELHKKSTKTQIGLSENDLEDLNLLKDVIKPLFDDVYVDNKFICIPTLNINIFFKNITEILKIPGSRLIHYKRRLPNKDHILKHVRKLFSDERDVIVID